MPSGIIERLRGAAPDQSPGTAKDAFLGRSFAHPAPRPAIQNISAAKAVGPVGKGTTFILTLAGPTADARRFDCGRSFHGSAITDHGVEVILMNLLTPCGCIQVQVPQRDAAKCKYPGSRFPTSRQRRRRCGGRGARPWHIHQSLRGHKCAAKQTDGRVENVHHTPVILSSRPFGRRVFAWICMAS